MNKSFDFYIDFISHYAFIAHNKIKKIEKDYMFKINYQPILLGGLHNLHEIKAPAFIPSKAKFMIRDCKMVSEKNKIDFKFNSYFPIKTLNLMRGVFVAAEDGVKDLYIDKMFKAIWVDGINMNDDSVIEKVLKNIDINPKTFLLRVQSQHIKDQLRSRTNDAFKKGILFVSVEAILKAGTFKSSKRSALFSP